MSETIHATCVAIGERGLLLIGAPGSGKSDLALRLIDRGAILVSDDGTMVEGRDGRLHARSGANIEGRLEVRGVGILPMPARDEIAVALVVAVDQNPERMPDEHLPHRAFDGIDLPVLALHPFEASAPIKIEKALEVYGLAS